VLQVNRGKGYRANKKPKNPYHAPESIGGGGQNNVVFGMGVMRV